MKTYKSHKTVKAAKILDVTRVGSEQGSYLSLMLDNGDNMDVDSAWIGRHAPEGRASNLVEGYLVEYGDRYRSWSPAEAFEQGYTEAFEQGYTEDDGKQPGLPVSGYRPQNQEALDAVNAFKADEERILRKLDEMREHRTAVYDQRWLSIGRTKLEEAFMAINRAVFKPDRVKLPEDGGPLELVAIESDGNHTTIQVGGQEFVVLNDDLDRAAHPRNTELSDPLEGEGRDASGTYCGDGDPEDAMLPGSQGGQDGHAL